MINPDDLCGVWIRNAKNYKGKSEEIIITSENGELKIHGYSKGKTAYKNLSELVTLNDDNTFDVIWYDADDSKGINKQKRKTTIKYDKSQDTLSQVSEAIENSFGPWVEIENEKKRSSYGNWKRK